MAGETEKGVVITGHRLLFAVLLNIILVVV